MAGLTTYLTMAYIAFVNPQILGDAGMDTGAVFVATCLAAAIGCAIMGLYANYPIAQAPGMGLNAFFTYGVGARHGPSVADGARRGLRLRRLLHGAVGAAGPRVGDQRLPALAQAGHVGRHRLLPGDHRHAQRRPGGGQRGDAGGAGRRHRVAGRAGGHRPRPHRGARSAAGDRRAAHRHPRGHGNRPRPRRQPVPRGRRRAAVHRAHAVRARHRRRARHRAVRRDLRVPVHRPVRHRRHADWRGAAGRPARRRGAAAARAQGAGGRLHRDDGRARCSAPPP